ncbi:MAG TPA: PQQ-binding-like beta-propeller repeat protein, partial [Pirellulales bacterium]|nr:PQQ-binding-like beta-propeller repeat protein [Pirellulales bacterium]
TLTLVAVRNRPPQRRRLALMGVLCLSWSLFLLLRAEGMGGNGAMAIRGRWSRSAEADYLTQPRAEPDALQAAAQQPLQLEPGDWPEFRGPNRAGELPDVRLDTDWLARPPKLVWKRRIGPAWSSVISVGDRLFTQEQLGEQEAVICLDAATGQTLWSHQDRARHEDVQGGAGPRATPTFSEGRIFTLGATGILNCLDAETGEVRWTRDIAADADTKGPFWGFSSSPLVVGDLVIVFACADFAEMDEKKLLRAYRSDSGDSAWSASAGRISYSSAQLATVDGETQLLFVSDAGLFAFDPTSGTELWERPTPPGNPGVPRTAQPRVVGPTKILADAGFDVGTVLLDVSRSTDSKTADAPEGGSWSVTQRWVSRQLKPSFNDFVTSGDCIYGFDGGVFSCIDLETGRRRWKKGHYGSGQVLLLGDEPLLMVVGEEGEVVLVAANPKQHQELARFQAIEGKTWNHPTIAHGRLYVRNSQEIACYDLQPKPTDGD